MNKRLRQKIILDVIEEVETETQDDLARELEKSGILVTQATLSRDIRDLNLVKTAGKNKKPKYYPSNPDKEHTDKKFLNMFLNCVTDIERAQNIVVVKTLGGNGNSAGVVVDKMNLSEVVGSVAGDDTLIIVTKTNEDAERITKKLKEYFVEN